MNVTYVVNQPIAADAFIDLLERSTLAQRRPVADRECIQGMLDHGNLLVAAYDGDKLVGVARSVTDFHFCCYLSDLAVDVAYQKAGIGRELIARTRAKLAKTCTVILLSAPAAVDYYPRIGFVKHEQAWVLKPDAQLL